MKEVENNNVVNNKADNKRLSASDEIKQIDFIFSGIENPNELVVDDKNYFLDKSVDYVGYAQRVNYMLGRIGEKIGGPKQYTDMLTNLKKDTRAQEALILIAKYADSKFFEANINALTLLFCGNSVNEMMEGMSEEEINDTLDQYLVSIINNIIPRIKDVKKTENDEEIYEEIDQTHLLLNDLDYNNTFAAYHDINTIIKEVREKDRIRVTFQNKDQYKHEFDREAWSNENGNYVNKLRILLGIAGDHLTDEEYAGFMLSISFKQEHKRELENCIKYMDFDDIFRSKEAFKTYFTSCVKGTGKDEKKALEVIQGFYAEKKKEEEEIRKAEREIREAEEDVKNAAHNHIMDVLENENPFDEVYDEYDEMDGGEDEIQQDQNEVQDAPQVNAAGEGQQNNAPQVNAAGIGQQNAPQPMSEAERKKNKAYLKAYISMRENLSSVYNKLSEFEDRLGRTQDNMFNNFDDSYPTEGSYGYQRLVRALVTLKRNLNNNVAYSTVLEECFSELYSAASHYYDDHYGFFGIKGTDKGSDRLAIAKDLKKIIPVMMNAYHNQCNGISVFQAEDGRGLGEKSQNEMRQKYNDIVNMFGPEIENDECMSPQPYQNQINTSRDQLKLVARVNGLSKTFARNYDYTDDYDKYLTIKQNMTDYDKAKYFTLKKYMDKAFKPGAENSDVRAVIEKVDNGLVRDEYKTLTKNNVFQECMRQNPQNGLVEWKRIEEETDVMKRNCQNRIRGFWNGMHDYITNNAAFLSGLSNDGMSDEALIHVNLIHDDIVDVVFGKIVNKDSNRSLANELITKPEKIEKLKDSIRETVINKYGMTLNKDNRGVTDAKLLGIFQSADLTSRALRDFKNKEAEEARRNTQQPNVNQNAVHQNVQRNSIL